MNNIMKHKCKQSVYLTMELKWFFSGGGWSSILGVYAASYKAHLKIQIKTLNMSVLSVPNTTKL